METKLGRSAYCVMVGVAATSAIALVAVFDPMTNPMFPPCLLRSVTGWLCPGCGSTRALHALVHGDFGTALRLNPLADAALPLVITEMLPGGTRFRAAMTLHVRFGYVYALGAAIVLFGILRNVPLLAPVLV